MADTTDGTPHEGDHGEHDDDPSLDLGAVAASMASQYVRAADTVDAAERLAADVGGELVRGREGLDAAAAERLEGLAARAVAHTALDLHQRSARTPDPDPHTVTTVDELRGLVRRIEQADQLVAASRVEVVERAAATDLAVHPDALRVAAQNVVEARSALAAAEAAADVDATNATAVPAAGGPADPGDEPDAVPGGVADVRAEEDDDGRRTTWDADSRRAVGRALGVVAAGVVLGVAVLALFGNPWVLVLPAVAACWVVVLLVRRRDREIDSAKTSQNLARVSALTDQAYGGFGASSSPTTATGHDTLDETPDRERRRRDAVDRLRHAESEWRALAGPEADVDDLDAVLQASDPQYRPSTAVVEAMPSVRAAAAHGRRLRAQWKLAWWALDRPVPPLDAAADAIDGLESEGIDEVVVDTDADASGERAGERARYEDLAGGRSIDELRAAAEQSWPPLVVADPDATVTPSRFDELATQFPEDVRLLVVVPPDGQTYGDMTTESE
ncbi:MAG: hypothetical protein U5K30_16975 [Acidimicrobiales bacterium]|nr:hypothetical protein [Acidimicrobiales bacterium]